MILVAGLAVSYANSIIQQHNVTFLQSQSMFYWWVNEQEYDNIKLLDIFISKTHFRVRTNQKHNQNKRFSLI